ncbi:MAG: phosphoglucosamine mutase [Planctomycetota bacterium]|jgi:phosphoglucosamine mutase
MKKKYFGTDGIRDVANAGNLTPQNVLRISLALGETIRLESPGKKSYRIALGGDTRISYHMIRAAITSGFTSLGWDVTDFGVLPTPALAHLTRSRNFDAGIMISASHNPMEDNGIKVFNGEGQKLSDEVEHQVEAKADDASWQPGLPTGAGLGRVQEEPSGWEEYMTHLLGFFKGVNLGKLKVAVDCANGASWKLAPEILSRLGAKVVVMANDPDGTNINRECGSMHTEKLAGLVKAEGCHAGFALDGDGDRCQFVDGRGRALNGDHLMAFTARQMQEEGILAQCTVVATIMSNLGLELSLKEAGILLVRTQVGDRYVTARMREEGFSLGGERSGHILFGKENDYTGDGVFTGLKVLKIMAATGRSLEDLASVMQEFPQVLLNVEVSRKPPFENLPAVMELVRDAESRLGEEGRVILRYSGTEKKARVMVEAKEASQVKTIAEDLVTVIKKEIG